jgi:predicted thioesterase
MITNFDDLVGLELIEQFVVTAEDLAVALGSGEVEVLATPRVIAWMEQVTVGILRGQIPTDSTSVGIHIDVVHRAPSIEGDTVITHARVNTVGGSKVIFDLVATNDEAIIASGAITRAVVKREEFTQRAGLNT